jgi:nucleotide-binding universal stress UspA family protein
MIRRILVALDGSFWAPAVFKAAVEIAEKFHSSIRVVRAISNASQAPTEPPTADALEEVARLVLQEPPRRLTIHPPLVRVGEPWKVIVTVSEELDIDLIVIGSHGYQGMDLLLGTNAERVVNLARRNVLVVHAPAGGQA